MAEKQYRQATKVEVKKQPFKIQKRTLAMIIVAALIVAGCVAGYMYANANSSGNYNSKVTDGSTEVITGDVTITKQGFYEYLLENYGADEVVNEAFNAICDELITDEDDIDDKVKETEELYASYYGSIKDYAEAAGYDSVDELEEDSLIPNAKQELLQEKYLEDNFKSVCKKYRVSYIKYVAYEKESSAVKAIKKIDSEDDYDAIAEKNSDDATDVGILMTKSSDSSVDENLISMAKKFYAMDEDGVYEDAVELSDGTYAMVYVYNTDRSKVKDDIVDTLASNSDVQKDIIAAYFKEYSFTIEDKRLKKEIEDINENYIVDEN